MLIERDKDSPRRGYTARSYIRALEEGLVLHYDETHHFQQDNAKIHIARATIEFLQEKRVSLIFWPAHSLQTFSRT